MMNFSCHCGLIRIEIKKQPDYIHACNCSLCRKSGARWGYFHPSEVNAEGPAKGYCREDKDDPAAEVQFCSNCGATTHFTLTASAAAKFGNSLMGVNMWLADESDLAGIELRYPDGNAWSGEGEFRYVRAARILGTDATP
ncbi:GFA family protein [Sphingosinicella soli]|uniref:CENP-V/GFA domain-containing protein n=1 Tax=Sphingosinicella soli TaxID=333708 RepID=A0A7W7F6K4_9SPHN|nr:aldehyde-activating protein [Sphingosinicella soli]MBB4632436.1 hypothetical protein [Sphingosinicella soli]